MISVGLVNDGTPLSKAVHDFYADKPGFDVVFEAKSERDLLPLLQKNKIEFLVLITEN